MTDRQKQALEFIREFEAVHGRRPGLNKLADHLGIKQSSAGRIRDRLVLHGHLGGIPTPDAERAALLDALKDFLSELTYLTPHHKSRRQALMDRLDATIGHPVPEAV